MELLRQHADRVPDKIAVTLLANGETESGHLTYRELDLRARAIAGHLQSAGLGGRCVLLLHPSGLEFVTAFFGCLYAGVIAVPVFPPRFNRNMQRLDHIIADTSPGLVLTTTSMMSRRETAPALSEIPWVATELIPEASADSWAAPALERSNIAFLQYTSGSTSAPKGVMVTHGNLLANHAMMQAAYDQDENSTIVCWMPLFHDMGLITALLQGLYLGSRVVIMPPETFIMKPARWLQAMSRYRAHSTGAPNFAYDLCVRKVTPEQCQDLDLSAWRLAMNAAEPVVAETLQQFTTKFAPYGFRQETLNPGYGLAEATAFVTSGACAALPVLHLTPPSTTPDSTTTRPKVACGPPWEGGQVLIVDPDSLEPCPPGVVGEIWLTGPHVAAGYWNQPEATTRTFHAFTAGGTHGPHLRTGDLGYMYQGELCVSGRLKDIVIVCGQNHDPADIELTVEASHPRIRPHATAAFGIYDGDTEKLVVLAELGRPARGETADGDAATLHTEILRNARRDVSEQHGITLHELVLLPPSSLPKTTSGKIQRHAARRLYLDRQLPPLSR
ncbi:fatty acyl-AMP ligase [Verrucomicrobium sp. BvORR034]|uniref:fatty acyl-AMP ligase n=1 Tax=Verrucomicrobium sp. BvORR034 TaxID=1396418 RepID=UPI0007C815CD|nr:fatty acyl-AMP ligase [Verrucomicrobium sp. BvORR034]